MASDTIDYLGFGPENSFQWDSFKGSKVILGTSLGGLDSTVENSPFISTKGKYVFKVGTQLYGSVFSNLAEDEIKYEIENN